MILREAISPESCEPHPSDPQTVAIIRPRMKPDATMVMMAETFKALGDPARAKILYALSLGELCVCDLAAIVGISDSGVSHQLRILRAMQLVSYRREGRQVFYTLADDHVRTLLAQGFEHVEERL